MIDENWLWLAFWTLHLALLLTLVTRLDPTERGDLSIAALIALTTAAIAPWLLPLHLITPLHEGFSLHHASQAVGLGGEGGVLLRHFWAPMLGPSPVLLDSMVISNLALGLGGSFLLALTAGRLARDPDAIGLVFMLFWLPPLGRHLLLSETAAAQVLLYSLALMIALRRPDGSGVLLGLLASVALALTRLELGLAGAVGLTIAAILHRRPTAVGAWQQALERTPARLAAAAVGSAVALSLLASWTPRSDTRWDFLLEGLAGSVITWLALPVALLAFAGPLLTALAVRGWVAALREPGRYVLLIALPWLFAVYFHAAHGGPPWTARRVATWELLRYALLLVPAVGVLAALGWRALGWQDLSARRRTAVLVALFVPSIPGAVKMLRPHQELQAPHMIARVDTVDQQETRALLEQLRREPACAVLTVGLPWTSSADRGPRWVLLDASTPEPNDRFAPWSPDDTVQEALGRLGHEGCVHVWRSVDCSTEVLDGCHALDTLVPRETFDWPHTRFTHPDHGHSWPDTVTVGWFALPP